MFAPHAALRLQHLKRVHVRGHFRTLSEARDVSTSSPLLFSPFSLAALAVHQHYSTIHQRKWKHSAISHSAQFGTSFGMSIVKNIYSKTKLYCGQLWRWFCRVKHAKRQGRRRFAESFGSFVGTIGGPHWRRVGLTSDMVQERFPPWKRAIHYP